MGNSYTLLETNDDAERMAAALSTERINARKDRVVNLRRPIQAGTIRTLAAVRPNVLVAAGEDKAVVVQDLEGGGFLTKWRNHDAEVTKVVYKRVDRNEFVLSGSADGVVRLCQFEVPEAIREYRMSEMRVGGLALLGEETIVAGGSEGSLCFFDANRRGCLKRVDAAGEMTHVAKTADESLLVQTAADRTLKLWDPRTFELVFQSPPRNFPLVHCDVNPDGLSCATASEGTKNEGCELTLWDLRQRRPVHHFGGHEASVRAVVFLPQQVTWKRLLLSVDDNHEVFLWDNDQRNYIWREEIPTLGPLTCAAGFVDGTVAVGGEDALAVLKLCSKQGTPFLSAQSLQTSYYKSLRIAQDLESVGMT